MNNFINLLNSLGIPVSVDSSAQPILLFLYLILFFSIFALLSVINIGIYLGVLYLSNNKLFLDKVSKWALLLTLLNIYKKTRIYFIISEVFLFLFCQCSIIWFCLKFINGIS
jgi:hypothetical protein